MNNFLDVVLPPLLLLVFGGALTGGLLFLLVARVRLWLAQANRIDGQRTAVSRARDCMAAFISEPGLDQGLRDRALASYEALSKMLTKEKDRT